MKKRTTNKLSMYQSVYDVMNEFQTLWQGVPALVGAMSNFGTKIDLLRVRLAEQSSSTTGIRAEKLDRVIAMRERMIVAQTALALLARRTSNIPLEKRNRLSMSELKGYSYPRLAVRCAELKADLETHGGDLADFGITAAWIAEVIPLLENFNEVNMSTRKAILKRKSVTQSIADLERGLDQLLRFDLDALLLVFKQNEPAFYSAFSNARTVIDYGHHPNGNSSERDDGLAQA